MFKTILWATDGSENADRALEYAKSLAQASGGKLVAVHSVETFTGSKAAGLPLFMDEDQLTAKVEDQVGKLAADGLDAEARIESRADRPAHTIADVARSVGADVIVIGTRGHTPLSGLLVGSVTQRLMHVAPCPVLAVPSVDRGGSEAAAEAGRAEQSVAT